MQLWLARVIGEMESAAKYNAGSHDDCYVIIACNLRSGLHTHAHAIGITFQDGQGLVWFRCQRSKVG